MISDQLKRRLAILAADIAGYSRLMGTDEEGTLARLKAHRSELIDPKNKQHRGRIVKTTGDDILIGFPSVVDRVRCAIEVQQGMFERNALVPQDKRVEFRVGINLGDVMVEGRDVDPRPTLPTETSTNGSHPGVLRCHFAASPDQ
jgi:adenylate cyclase